MQIEMKPGMIQGVNLRDFMGKLSRAEERVWEDYSGEKHSVRDGQSNPAAIYNYRDSASF